MIKLAALVVLLASPAFAADAPKAKTAAKAAPTFSRTAGTVVKVSMKPGKGVKDGQFTLKDDAGHLEDFLVDAKTGVTCDGKRVSLASAAKPGACDRAVRVLYDSETKRARVVDLKRAAKAAKPGADDAAGRPNVSGEVASTDVIAGKISVRLGGGTTLDFKVGDATRVLIEAEGKPAAEGSFESIKVGDRVEVHSKDMKTADELHVRAPAR